MNDIFRMKIMERDDRGRRQDTVFVWRPKPEHRNQALNNHGQTLERLNERGGVCWSELEGILVGWRWGDLRNDRVEAKRVCLALYPQDGAAG